ncbi:hypothetical protein [Spirosoma pulveris]
MLLVLPCFGQQKYEREYTIKPSAVPQQAARFINDVFTKATIHWYGEVSLTGTTIEAKLKSGGKRYSIEFDPSGKIQDVEIQRRFNQIPAQTRQTLSEGLSRKFDQFAVVKTQLQWTAGPDDLKTAILTNKLPSSVKIRYELILKARKNRSASYYEVLCEQNGVIVSIHQLVQRNNNNLIY